MRVNLLQSVWVGCATLLTGFATAQAQTATNAPLLARLDGTPAEYKIHNREWQRAMPQLTGSAVPVGEPLRSVGTSSLLQQATRPANALSAGKTIGGGESARSIIKYAPLVNFGYERVLQNNHSVYVGLSIYALGAGYSALGLKGEYRFYGLIKSSPKQAPEGFWVAPTAQIWRLSVKDTYYSGGRSLYVLHVGGMAGYQWIFNNRIALEPALGLAVGVVGSNADYGLAAGVLPLVALRVGYVLE